VDLLPAEVGSKVDLNVLMLGGDGNVTVGTPLVDGAKVVAEVIEHLRADKIRILKYKNKTRRRQRMGHRQDLTRLQVKEIVGADGSVSTTEKPKRRADTRPSGRKKAGPEPEPEAALGSAVEAAPEAEVQEAPKPRRARTPKAKAEAGAPETGEAAPETEAPAADASKEPAPEAAADEAETPAPKTPRKRRSQA
jgi:large subunit ribosomal protein L21